VTYAQVTIWFHTGEKGENGENGSGDCSWSYLIFDQLRLRQALRWAIVGPREGERAVSGFDRHLWRCPCTARRLRLRMAWFRLYSEGVFSGPFGAFAVYCIWYLEACSKKKKNRR
jgi:hypothetical protein